MTSLSISDLCPGGYISNLVNWDCDKVFLMRCWTRCLLKDFMLQAC